MVVPLFLGWKADPMMSAWRQVQREVDGQGLVFDGQDLSHREVLVTWLLNASNRYLPVRRDEAEISHEPLASSQVRNLEYDVMQAIECHGPLLLVRQPARKIHTCACWQHHNTAVPREASCRHGHRDKGGDLEARRLPTRA